MYIYVYVYIITLYMCVLKGSKDEKTVIDEILRLKKHLQASEEIKL